MTAYALLLTLLAARPAGEPARPYDAQHYRIELRLGNDGAFDNTLQLTLVPASALRQVELDSFGLDVQKVALGDAEVPFSLKEDPKQRTGTLTLKPKTPLAAKKPVTFVISYRGKANTEGQEGFFRTTDPENEKLLPYFFTHFEPESARRFFPCNDRPDDKATTEVFAIVDPRYLVLSNGSKVQDETFTEKGVNLRRVHWKQEQPHAPYLVAVAVGQFDPVEVSVGAPATIWVKPGTKDRAFLAVDASEHAFRFQQRFTGVKYPWAKFDQVVVPRFTAGGMENTSLIFMREPGLVLADKNHIDGRTRVSGLVAHELAHQWFGDDVTCKSWSDLWLNEGFATYMTWKTEDAYYENDLADVSRVARLIDGYFRDEDGPRSHPLVAKGATAREGFDSTSYTKGAQLLWMLEKWVGEENFKKGIKAYLEKHAFGAASSEDFFAAFTRATGTEKELKGFRDSWLYQRGYPVVTPQTTWSGDTLTVTIRQRPNHPDVKGAFVFKLPVVFHREGTPSYSKEEVILVDKPVVTATVQLPAPPTWVNWNKDQAALVKIDEPAVSEEAWAQAVRADPDPTWRTVAAYHLLGTMVSHDAEKLNPPSETATEALRFLIQEDPSPYVRQAVLGWMAQSQWKRLPMTFASTILDVARRPTGLPEDALGTIRVRKAALTALGKFDSPEGRQHLLDQVMKRDVDLNYLSAYAQGVALLGDSVALSTLRATVNASKARGYPYYRDAVNALGSVTTPEVVPHLVEVFRQNAGNNELITGLLYALDDNRIVKTSPELAVFVKNFVLTDKTWGDAIKGRVLRLLDDVKTDAAKDALTEIAAKTDSFHLQNSARKVLTGNFAVATPQVTPAKGTRK